MSADWQTLAKEQLNKIADLERRLQNHESYWLLVILFGVPIMIALMTKQCPEYRDPWYLANRCQTLKIIQEASGDNLLPPGEEHDPRDKILAEAIESAIQGCTEEQFNERPIFE